MEKLKEEMGLNIPIRLWYCSVIKTPFSIGMRKRNKITCLPGKNLIRKKKQSLSFCMNCIISSATIHIRNFF